MRIEDRLLYHRLGSKRLLRPAPAVTRIDRMTGRLIDRMLDLMRRSGYPALAAPQVGIDQRLITVDLTGKGTHPIVLVNPEVEAVSLERAVDREGCLSLPGVLGPVPRHVHIVVRWLARSGQFVRLEAAGLMARILQHKLDHLDGLLILDRMSDRRRATLIARLRDGSLPPSSDLSGRGSPPSRPSCLPDSMIAELDSA